MGILQRLRRQARIQAGERLAKSPLQHHVAVLRITALGAGRGHRNVRAVQHRVAESLEPGEGGLFDGGFAARAASLSIYLAAELGLDLLNAGQTGIQRFG